MTELQTSTELTASETATIRQTAGSAASVVAAARELTIDTPEQMNRADGILRDLATVRKVADRQRLDLTKPLRDKVDLLNAQYKAPMAMLAEADDAIRAKRLAYEREQRRLAKIEQDRLDAIAEEQRLADEAGRAKAAAEARAQAEAWRAREADLAATAKATNDAEIQRAADAAKAAADAMADLERARAIEPLPVRPVQVVEAAAKTAGVATRKTWTFSVERPADLPRAFVMPNEGAIRKYMQESVKAGNVPKLQGVRFLQQEQLAVRSR